MTLGEIVASEGGMPVDKPPTRMRPNGLLLAETEAHLENAERRIKALLQSLEDWKKAAVVGLFAGFTLGGVAVLVVQVLTAA